jgi:iron(III) transport system ATP-binding protein
VDNFFHINQLNYAHEQHAILHDLTLSMQAGECIALLGPSGVGKSTLLQIIAGLLPASDGAISLQQRILTQNGKHIIPCEKRGIGMVFQDYALFPQMHVNANIAFGLQQHRQPKQKIEQRVQELLSLMHMESLGQRYPNELSGGQQQRVALARALAVEPKLLLLDEPFANIDSSVRVKLHAELQRIIREQHLSVLLVTHDRQEAFALAHRVGILVPTAQGAELAQLASPQEVYQKPSNVMVAQLTGALNLFSGYLENDSVETALGKWPCTGNHQGAGMVMVRPEQLEFLPEVNGLARIISKQFMGADYRLVVESPVGALMVDAPLSLQVNAGDKGTIRLLEPAWAVKN